MPEGLNITINEQVNGQKSIWDFETETAWVTADLRETLNQGRLTPL